MTNNWLSPTPVVSKTTTTNGDVAFTSTGTFLLDFFTSIGLHRDSARHVKAFNQARLENELLAIRALFYARDVRSGQGERELFRACFKQLPTDVRFKYAQHIAEFGRWDDIFATFTNMNEISPLIQCQLHNDWVAAREGKPISLLAKWMPSENASSKRTRERARAMAKALGLTAKEYRVILSHLRGKLNLIETSLSAKVYDSIDIQLLPSRALRKYKSALKKHVPTQFAKVMAEVTKAVKVNEAPKAKINTKALYPYEALLESDRALRDAQWAQMIRDRVYATEDTLVVCDVSGSMGNIGHNYNSEVQPIHVAISLAMYFAETNSAGWKDKFITFSLNPQIQNLVGSTLTERALNLSRAHWEMNTNIDAVFALIFQKAQLAHLAAPKNIVIVSDMQFDKCAYAGGKGVFDKWKDKFRANGLVLPTVVFWNVADTSTKPVTAHQSGAILISGKSPAASQAFKTAMSGVTPYDSMIQLLNSERYSVIV